MLGLLGLIPDGRVVLQTRRLQVPRFDFLTVLRVPWILVL